MYRHWLLHVMIILMMLLMGRIHLAVWMRMEMVLRLMVRERMMVHGLLMKRLMLLRLLMVQVHMNIWLTW